MEICILATHTAILCILFSVISWANVNANRYRSGEVISRRIRADRTSSHAVNDTLQEFNNSLSLIKLSHEKFNDILKKHTATLGRLQKEIMEINTAMSNHDDETRVLQKNTSSIAENQRKFEEELDDFKSELADVKKHLTEDRKTQDQKFVAPLETLNQTVQHLSKSYEDLLQQVAELKTVQERQVSVASEASNKMKKALEDMLQVRDYCTSEIALLKAEQQQQASAALKALDDLKNMKVVFQQVSQFRDNYTSKADLRVKRAISNKCSLNVRHKPESDRMDVLMALDPPHFEPYACN